MVCYCFLSLFQIQIYLLLGVDFTFASSFAWLIPWLLSHFVLFDCWPYSIGWLYSLVLNEGLNHSHCRLDYIQGITISHRYPILFFLKRSYIGNASTFQHTSRTLQCYFYFLWTASRLLTLLLHYKNCILGYRKGSLPLKLYQRYFCISFTLVHLCLSAASLTFCTMDSYFQPLSPTYRCSPCNIYVHSNLVLLESLFSDH